MRLVSFVPKEKEERPVARLGLELDGSVVDLDVAGGREPAFASLVAFADRGAEALTMAREIEAQARQGRVPEAWFHAAQEIQLLAPVPRPSKNVICVGLNYRSHVEQNARARGEPVELPEVPLFFSKPVTAIVGPGAPVRRDSRLTSRLDYEVELAVVMGRRAKWLDEATAMDAVLGLTLVNDVTARDLQWRTSQFFYANGLDTFCPMGPVVVTLDELPAWQDIVLELTVNDEVRQREPAGAMLFPVSRVLAELTKGITLEPGDVVSLGTPGGCGYQLDPPRYLEPGDVVRCRAEGIGELVNPVVEQGDPCT